MIFRYGLVFGIILIFLHCGLTQKIQEKIPKPQVQIESLVLKEVTFTGLQLQLLTNLQNPYNVSLPYSQLDSQVFLNGKSFTKIRSDLGALPAKGNRTVPVDLILRYTDLLSLVRSNLNQESFTLKLDGNLKLPVPESHQKILGIQEFTFPILVEKPIPNFQPDLSISNFRFNLPNIQEFASSAASSALGGILGKNRTENQPEILAEFDLIFRNRATASFLLDKLKFQMDLEGQPFIQLSPTERIQENNTNRFQIQTKIPINDTTKNLVSILQKKEARFQIAGDSIIGFPEVDKLPATFRFQKDGQLRLR